LKVASTQVEFFHLQMSSDNMEMREMAARICRDYLRGSWRKIKAQDIVLKRIR
jgi:hypothetical protein